MKHTCRIAQRAVEHFNSIREIVQDEVGGEQIEMGWHWLEGEHPVEQPAPPHQHGVEAGMRANVEEVWLCRGFAERSRIARQPRDLFLLPDAFAEQSAVDDVMLVEKPPGAHATLDEVWPLERPGIGLPHAAGEARGEFGAKHEAWGGKHRPQ